MGIVVLVVIVFLAGIAGGIRLGRRHALRELGEADFRNRWKTISQIGAGHWWHF